MHAQPATTLIFKDGRPPAQVHNYALTGSTLYALDGESRQEIPLSLLNVPATVEANRDCRSGLRAARQPVTFRYVPVVVSFYNFCTYTYSIEVSQSATFVRSNWPTVTC